ncbi:orotidine-5'-phosphate decarboxylase [Magnetospirillum moscoviense]|uniref:Orotidine 5'-phosphate decarboxylase n=1 Tax=Magnetospirillum moscoviense TaxID=1437059 RepID=A0A178MYP6_9PROT|nr:orotidine-5'-phosphate decarboxylase [Magnetospirillum moscoviense]OAN55147.1 orotidine 5'-phosphate decarboxylase [Magnetospirillum moscoviense]
MPNPVYVAVDTTNINQAVALATSLKGLVGGVKLGLEFFSVNGPAGIEAVAGLGMPVFLDLKLHDIPNTVAGAMKGVARLAPRLTTIHASGGLAMMKAAVDMAREEAARVGRPATKVLAVTILTSIDQAAMAAIGYGGTVLDQVKRLADLAEQAGIDGLVCSPHEVAALRAQVRKETVLVVPGIRPTWAEAGDQKRIMTPSEARAQGADILVIGRPITGAADPAAAARRIAEELGV